jgi:hypothetical protein
LPAASTFVDDRWPAAPPSRAAHPDPARLADVEIFYTGLLILVALAVVWFAGYVIYRLLHEDR